MPAAPDSVLRGQLRRRYRKNPPPDTTIHKFATNLANRFGGAQRLDPRNVAQQGISEVLKETGRAPEGPARRQTLLQSVLKRSTATSQQRALNRLLATEGLTTGASGTRINPRRKLPRR